MATAQRPAPRDHLLATASRLFYTESINGVGVDRIVREAGVTRATLYRHFPGKEALVVAYLERVDGLFRARWQDELSRAVSPDHALELAIGGMAEDAYHEYRHGCPFTKAAGEFPDPENAIRQVVTRHRAWFLAEMRALLTAAGRADVAAKAETVAMLRDALMIGCFLDDPDVARRTFVRTARSVAGLR